MFQRSCLAALVNTRTLGVAASTKVLVERSMNEREKPQGASGPISIGADVEWQVIKFPAEKKEREFLIARLFIESFERWVAMQSEPSLAPFRSLRQNNESDLDFTVETAAGEKLLELAEFAPLSTHGPTFAQAPKTLDPKEKAPLVEQLIRDKSAHQGGDNRFLVLYTTEQGFWLDPVTIERLRRRLGKDAPKFERVYCVSLHDIGSASVSEIFPGRPHHIIGDYTDERLDRQNVQIPHPSEMVVGKAPDGASYFEVSLRRPNPEITVSFGEDTTGRRSSPHSKGRGSGQRQD